MSLAVLSKRIRDAIADARNPHLNRFYKESILDALTAFKPPRRLSKYRPRVADRLNFLRTVSPNIFDTTFVAAANEFFRKYPKFR